MKAKRWWVYVYLEAGTRLYPSRSFGPFTSLDKARRLAERIAKKGFWEKNLTDFIPPHRVDGVSVEDSAPPKREYEY